MPTGRGIFIPVIAEPVGARRVPAAYCEPRDISGRKAAKKRDQTWV
jgi:hypothetical protein